jgi:hypothetical protein
MVCFCDLPLSLIKKHLEEYGPFGIGLDKRWGLKNRVSPILYTHRSAQTLQPILQLIPKDDKVNDYKVENDLRLLAAYTKPFIGPAWRNKKVKRNVKFYNEREWRYVVRIKWDETLFLNWEDYHNEAKRNKLHKRFKNQNALLISPDSIQYLIVPYDKEENNILELYKYIMSLYARRYSREDAMLVTTTIMTDDCIKEDV